MNESNVPEEIAENAISPNIDPPKDSKAIRPEPSNLFEKNPIDLDALRTLEGQNILKAGQFSFEQVTELCKLAAVLEKI